MARPRKTNVDASLLEAALEGLELQKSRIDDQIREVRRMLGKGPARASTKPTVTTIEPIEVTERKKRALSPAARKRIAAAQKKRWAAFRKTGTPAEKES